jgi:hypothetical protein
MATFVVMPLIYMMGKFTRSAIGVLPMTTHRK